jgi:hypothetical protein
MSAMLAKRPQSSVYAPQFTLSRFWKQLLPEDAQEVFGQKTIRRKYTLRRIVYLKPRMPDNTSHSRAWKFNSASILVRLSRVFKIRS